MKTKTATRLVSLTAILALLLTLALPAWAAFTATTVDNGGVGGDIVGLFTSLALNAAGNPVISYWDLTSGDLKVAVCADATCTAGNTLNTVDGVGGVDVGAFTSLVLNGAGNPVISYVDLINFDLKVAVCADATCTTATRTTVDGGGGVDVGQYTSLELNGGHPVISYHDATNGDLKLAVCDDATCTTPAPTLTTVDATPGDDVGEYTSLVLNIAGHPVISYYDATNGDLNVATCDDPTCTNPTLRNVDSGGVGGDAVGEYTSLALNASGHPVISYYDLTNQNLKLAVCGDPICNTATLTTVDTTGDVGQYTSLVLNGAGNPVISYLDNTNVDLKVAVCGNATCTTGNTLTPVDTTGDVGDHTSLALNGAGRPVISYFDVSNGDLKVAVDVPAPEIAVLGNSVEIADGDATPSLADHTDFGSVIVGQPRTHVFTIRNSGDANLTLSGTPRVAIGGQNPGDFSVVAIPTTPVGSNATTTFEVRFSPSAPGLRAATVTIANDDSDENPYTFAIQGTGALALAPEIAVLGNTVEIADGDATPFVADHTDFGSVTVGQPRTHVFTISNSGTADLTLSGTPRVALSGPAAGDFSVVVDPTTPVGPNTTTTFEVRFTPTAAGLRAATLTIANNDGDEQPYDFAIRGSGALAVAPEIAVLGNTVEIADGDTSPATADHTDFGSLSVGQAFPHSFTISNSGNGDLILSGTPRVAISGPAASDFSVVAIPTTPVGSDTTTSFEVRFHPSAGGLRAATVTIANNDSDEQPYDFAIQGTGRYRIALPLVRK